MARPRRCLLRRLCMVNLQFKVLHYINTSSRSNSRPFLEVQIRMNPAELYAFMLRGFHVFSERLPGHWLDEESIVLSTS